MKTKHHLMAVAYMLFVATAVAQLADAEQAQFVAKFREAMHLDQACARIKAGEIDQNRLAIVRAVLSATSEVFIHQQRGATKNQIYLSPDGHREAVFGADGKLVADGMNDSSYNYFHPGSDAMRHFLFDIHPWILWGMSQKDPTTPSERIFSYVSDLERGIAEAARSSNFERVDPAAFRVGEIEAYAVFMRVIEEGGATEFFDLIEQHRIPDSAGLVPLLRKLESGFRRVYGQ
jgi:hypothetical protein